ncbi:glutamate--cysteine ligase [Ktedonosporobacter rubrisoli]|uniref:Glutamate--cysteine ligase n=1 Tax=Ktedonosporobacter rubrisoli TaxID=2509675 RepID=A0A4P6JMI0_KTERU|nr:glutamate--cysteine ligase [Ktedonosporobacter rubrisoli]QBD76260.1 glutamate--cysteine ligase [Ktedonosporobacter rubrisoli]
MFKFGIEHEVALLNKAGQFVDFASTPFADLDSLISQLPLYEEDYPQLRIGDAGIKKKRWYIEGFERYDSTGAVTACLPKGIEIRTTLHASIQRAVEELTTSFRLLSRVALSAGFVPVLVSFNPYYTEFVPDPPLSEFERQRKRQSPEKRTATIPMLTYGPDLNFSLQGLSTEEIIDIGRKLTYYSPYIIPFSYSSPFYGGKLWQGLSVRTFVRTGPRPAVMVFLGQPEELIDSDPSLTKIARLPAEVGRIEFKACDSCADFTIYAALLALLKGLAGDKTLQGRATTPDASLHQHSSLLGFASKDIADGTHEVLQAAASALGDDPDKHWLEPLYRMLESQQTPADELIKKFQQSGSIEESLRATYAADMAEPALVTPAQIPHSKKP